MGEQLPIIYVRGFAGDQSGIDKAVDDPFYGFNEGSTHIRVGTGGEPRFYQFESMLLRLMEDHGYGLPGDREGRIPPARSVWIYRFYDRNTSTFGGPSTPYRIEDAADGLGGFVRHVLDRTVAGRVYLVAHSMGGLICRSLLQRSPEHAALVSKLVTIGTPHGGIDPKLGGGIGDWIMDTFSPQGSDIFGHERMGEYLLPDDLRPPPDGWDPRVMVGGFPAARALSIVGTDARDYDAAGGWSTRVMGEQSDGLVAIPNAYVKTSPRAYVHRAHSGRYGLVNSEEAYQNLRRFLFGDLRVDTALTGLTLDDGGGRAWQADFWMSIRGLPVLMHEQTAAHHCPVDLLERSGTVPLVSVFLLPPPPNRPAARYALNLRVIALDERGGVFGFGDHLEQIADWEDTLIVDIEAGQNGSALRAGSVWNSSLRGRVAEAGIERMDWDGGTARVALPDLGRALLGASAALTFTASLWN